MTTKFYGITKLEIAQKWQDFLKQHGVKSKINIDEIINENERYMVGRCKRIYPILEFKKFGRLGIRFNENDLQTWFCNLAVMLYDQNKLKEALTTA